MRTAYRIYETRLQTKQLKPQEEPEEYERNLSYDSDPDLVAEFEDKKEAEEYFSQLRCSYTSNGSGLNVFTLYDMQEVKYDDDDEETDCDYIDKAQWSKNLEMEIENEDGTRWHVTGEDEEDCMFYLNKEGIEVTKVIRIFRTTKQIGLVY